MPLVIPVVCLVGISLLMGLFPSPVYELAREASRQMFDADAYIQAVLGGKR